MKAKDLREKSTEELRAQVLQVKRNLLGFYLKGASGEKVDPSEKRNARRDIARINTLLRERELVRDAEGRLKILETQAPQAGAGTPSGRKVLRELSAARRRKAVLVRQDPGIERDR